MERRRESQARVDGGGAGVGELGPELLVVGLDGGPILGEGEADADVGIHVAVGDVVDELADGPAAVAIGGVELRVVQAGDGGAEIFRQGGEDGDGGGVVGEVRLRRGGIFRWGSGGRWQRALRVSCSYPQGTIRRADRPQGAGQLRRGGVLGCRCAFCGACGGGGSRRRPMPRTTPQTMRGSEEHKLLHGGFSMAHRGIDGIEESN